MAANTAKKNTVKNRSVPEVVEKASSEKPAEPIEAKPAKKPNAVVLHVYRRLYTLRAVLRNIDPKMAKTTDRMLASIGYPARLISYLFGIPHLAQLSGTISDYRTLSRVVATPAAIEYSLDLLLDNKNPDKLDRYAEYVQGVAGIFYQVLEDLAYLGDKKILSISAKTRADFWVYSSISWAFDVVIELLRIPYYRFVLHKEISYRKLAVNLAWLPLTYHWSTYTGVFDDGWVGLLGTCACWPNMVYQWKQAGLT